MRETKIVRNTSETQITLSLNLDKAERGKIQTGSGFLDHMLDLFQVHGGFCLNVECHGDVQVDMHHSVEDIAICLGEALLQCLGDKKGIERYGFYFVPMDEALARVCIDFSNRIGIVWNAKFPNAMVGAENMPVILFEHFFKTLGENARMNLHVELFYGSDNHHCLEAIFKAFARAVAMAVAPSRNVKGVPSSKGTL
ncbi:imidazoleglycerol-phosphate dehydratase HisB [uncultured Fibrobacter sp.]|uniref:imidazoleglycerol-phosphate dehydratase HisB n=1 Tax=uncultured Fibrobacter sp. TaxID=261512 RepID=UPI00259AA1CA|nr:imidazoleglycerol-phosphate dehydratase HisB [uncultured Fibrobacter sp.]